MIKAFCTDYYWYYGYADYQSCVDGLMDYFYGSGGSTGGDGYYEELIKAFCTDYYWYYGYADY